MMPSPVCFISRPLVAPSAVRTIRSCTCSMASAISSPRRCVMLVEPTMSVNRTVRVPGSRPAFPGRRAAPALSLSAAPMNASARSGVTFRIRAAASPWASRCTASAAFALGAVQRQKILPCFSFTQYLTYSTPCFPWTLRSSRCAFATSSEVTPGTSWMSIYMGMAAPPDPEWHRLHQTSAAAPSRRILNSPPADRDVRRVHQRLVDDAVALGEAQQRRQLLIRRVGIQRELQANVPEADRGVLRDAERAAEVEVTLR